MDVSMISRDDLTYRIRGEFHEMPGLRLTLPQAVRLWGIDAGVCQALLDRLVQEKTLARTADGSYVALPSPRTPLKPPLPQASAARQWA